MTVNKKNDITLNFNSERAITAVAECFKEYLGKMRKESHFRSRNAGRILLTDPNILKQSLRMYCDVTCKCT